MSVTKQTIKVKLEKHETLEATGITIPFDVEEVFGAKRVAVKATINGAVYRGSIVRMGGKYMLGIPKTFRQEAGLKAGDNIVVTIERDEEERTVTVPSDLAQELRLDRSLNEDGKKPETRVRRLKKTLEMLRSKAK